MVFFLLSMFAGVIVMFIVVVRWIGHVSAAALDGLHTFNDQTGKLGRNFAR